MRFHNGSVIARRDMHCMDALPARREGPHENHLCKYPGDERYRRGLHGWWLVRRLAGDVSVHDRDDQSGWEKSLEEVGVMIVTTPKMIWR